MAGRIVECPALSKETGWGGDVYTRLTNKNFYKGENIMYINKTRLIKSVSILCLVSLLLVSTVNVLAQTNDTLVSETEANLAASYYLNYYNEEEDIWKDTNLSAPITYYSVKDQPIAYEYSVLNREGLSIGYLIISATKDWMPLLERGEGKAPSAYLGDAYAIALNENLVNEGEFGNPVIYYFGGLSYYTQFGPTMIEDQRMIHLRSGMVIQKPTEQLTLCMDKEKANAEWNKLNKAAIQSSSIVPIIGATNQQQSNTIIQITGVPSWHQSSGWSIFCDEGGGALSYPDCQGPPDDPWANWDGCGPIAGAMVLGYWGDHGYSSFPTNDDEYLIDDCHYYMGTSDAGSTTVTSVAPGIADVSELYGYDFTCNFDSSVSWADITNEIDNGRPFVLMVNSAEFGGSHAITVRGYDSSTSLIYFHNTWDDFTNDITFGNWNWAYMATVIPGY